MRLDVMCASRLGSRTKAQDLIKEGKVKVNGTIQKKPSLSVAETDVIEIDDSNTYVSRGAYKLKGCLDTFEVSLDNEVVLDIGASTGGFTQIALEYGACKVYALDVGHLQLDSILEKDCRVIKMEGMNAREIDCSWFEDSIHFFCMDVSFISAKTILIPVLETLKVQHCAFLIKPQFECGPKYLNHKGVLKNKKIEKNIVDDYRRFMLQYFKNVQIMPSVIKGRHGNQEFMLYANERR